MSDLKTVVETIVESTVSIQHRDAIGSPARADVGRVAGKTVVVAEGLSEALPVVFVIPGGIDSGKQLLNKLIDSDEKDLVDLVERSKAKAIVAGWKAAMPYGMIVHGYDLGKDQFLITISHAALYDERGKQTGKVFLLFRCSEDALDWCDVMALALAPVEGGEQ